MSTAVTSLPDDTPTITLDEAKRLDGIVDEKRESAVDYLEAIVKLRETRGWRLLGFKSWADYAAAKGPNPNTLSRSFVYRQLQAALVAKELEADETHKQPLVAPGRQVNSDALRSKSRQEIPVKHLVALSAAPEGTRTEVLGVATQASAGNPTEKVIKAAVEAKKANPDATPAELVKTVVNGVAKVDRSVEQARAAGKIPAGVVVEVEDPGEDATTVEDVREEHEEAAAKRDEMSDEEWLGTLPLAATLAGPQLRAFEVDATAYRQLEPHRKTFEHHLRRVKAACIRKTKIDLGYLFRIFRLVLVQHPKDWKPCPSMDLGGCGGSGQVAMVGECPKCQGRGYILQ